MRLFVVFILVTFLINFNTQCKDDNGSAEIVTVDFTMAERGVEWLEFIKTEPGDKAIKEYFFKNIASTKGCESIIKHWARFTEWDNERFYDFVIEALGLIPSDLPLKNEDGSLTNFGKRHMLWTAALADPAIIKNDIKKLKKMNLVDTSQILAKMYLPDDANIENDFYFVMFGGSNAFSIGKENGFDILQLSKTRNGSINVDEVLLLLAHEMHHSGFLASDKEGLGDNMLLLGVLAAEGMPTYFIDKTITKIESYKTGHNKILNDLAVQWESHLERMPEIYFEAEKDIELNLGGKIGQKEIWARWMEGLQGQAYALGSDMFSVIDRYIGLDSAKIVPYNNRQFLRLYNKAAQIGNSEGGNYYIFDDKLVDKVINN